MRATVTRLCDAYVTDNDTIMMPPLSVTPLLMTCPSISSQYPSMYNVQCNCTINVQPGSAPMTIKLAPTPPQSPSRSLSGLFPTTHQ